MRSLFFWFGVLSALVVAAGAAGFIYLAHVGSGLDKASRDYANDSMAAITTHWDAQELKRRASPELAQSVSPEKMAALFAWFSTLGSLIGQQECGGASAVYAMSGQKTRTTARYACAGQYEHGPATIELQLIREDKKWMINGFHVNSPALIPQNLQKS